MSDDNAESPSVQDVRSEPGNIPFVLTTRPDAMPIGQELDALVDFRAAARNLKSCEAAFRAAQQTYAEAVKKLSEAAAP